ncbi:MAG TPA: YceI family protein [Vicinamibacterales bacterium]|nr:YceI family protein [Vicinamibacterales bacterium]
MTRQFVRSTFGSTFALAAALTAGSITLAQAPLAIDTAEVSIAGTSNIHDYTATTSSARVTRVQLAADVAGAAFWDEVQKPGGLEAFDISIPAASLKSTKEGLDKNMYKALKVKEHAEITFSLKRMEGAPGALTATGILRIAGVEREVALPLKTARKGDKLAVTGALDVLMTDYGIAPPKAMMGMVRADPKIKITFAVLLGLVTT